ncbi:uncharacterized protein C8Q71DRAFT_846164 [Rhodofomes roseus]|uniref:Homeobox domain-containing protein n=1 Tax=Rhodofomes roseus TaxID=34475 RepID=A0ABQ8KQH0_9APHY|nr:uncharacterized protein C8Q71DRAFT_846164 [Rhodofomes roseus]KAH9840876.1 hypothetical protein C8Q71DRAFT_846164 [Rhodofomes roseus]
MSRPGMRTLRATLQAPADEDIKPSLLKYPHLTKEQRTELEGIWKEDSRIPTVESRRVWAEARNIEPRLVHNWFSKKRARTVRLGVPVPAGTYELQNRVEVELPATLPSNAAYTVKRERSPSPSLSQPVKKRQKTAGASTPRTILPGKKSGSRTRNSVKIEDGVFRVIPVRHTRKHATNPHPACLTCIRAHTATVSYDLPPSSPPPSSPSAIPELTFSSDAPSSDVGLESPLTPIASDGEEAEIEAYLNHHSSAVGTARIYPPPRKHVPRSIKQSARTDAYTHLGSTGVPSTTPGNDFEEILSFTPSPSPEPDGLHGQDLSTAPRARKKRKRVRFSEQTMTFLVDPFRSDHRFSYDAEPIQEGAGPHAETSSCSFSSFALVPVPAEALSASTAVSTSEEASTPTSGPTVLTSTPSASATAEKAGASTSGSSAPVSTPAVMVPGSAGSAIHYPRLQMNFILAMPDAASSTTKTISPASGPVVPPFTPAAAPSVPIAPKDVIIPATAFTDESSPPHSELHVPPAVGSIPGATPFSSSGPHNQPLHDASPALATNDMSEASRLVFDQQSVLSPIPFRLPPSPLSIYADASKAAEVLPLSGTNGSHAASFAIAAREEEEEQEVRAAQEEEEEEEEEVLNERNIGLLPGSSATVPYLDDTAIPAPPANVTETVVQADTTTQTMIVRAREEDEDSRMDVDEVNHPAMYIDKETTQAVDQINPSATIIGPQEAAEPLSLIESDDEEPLAVILARQRVVKIEREEVNLYKTDKGKKRSAPKKSQRKVKEEIIEAAVSQAVARAVKLKRKRKAPPAEDALLVEATASSVVSDQAKPATATAKVQRKRAKKIRVKTEQDAVAVPDDSEGRSSAPVKRKRVRVKTESSAADNPPTTQVKRTRRAGKKAASDGAQETPKVSTTSRARVAGHGPEDANAASSRPSVQAAPLYVESDTPLMFATVYGPQSYVLGTCSSAALASMGIVFSGGIQWMEDEFESMELSAFCWMKPVRTGPTKSTTANDSLT